MTNVDLLLATLRFQRVDREGRVRNDLMDELRRRSLAPGRRPCCAPPCCFCCWEAV